MSTAKLNIQILEHSVILSHPVSDRIPQGLQTASHFGMRSQHYAWPGITRAQNGDLLVAASERVRHADPFGREVICRSTDNGKTWSNPTVFFDSDTDDRDPSLCVLPSGTVIATWFSSSLWADAERTHALWLAKRNALSDGNGVVMSGPRAIHNGSTATPPGTLVALDRGWLRRSHDHGKTWEPYIYPTIVGVHAGPSVCANGDLIYCGSFQEERFVCTKSTDGGLTWSIIGHIDMGHVDMPVPGAAPRRRLAFNECHCLEVSLGHLICALRKTQWPQTIHFSTSHDGGVTWSDPADTGVFGFPPTLTRLSSGAILCVHADRRHPQAVRAILSYDQGKTWDTQNVLTIREFEHQADMGYPSAIELSPGELLCVYYYVPHPPHLDAPYPALQHTDPAKAGILATRLRLS